MKVVALAGGVGGAKLVDGLAELLSPDEFCVIVNTGDDFKHLSLHISPDLDTVCYTLAGIANPETGWGLRGDSFVTLQALDDLGGDSWFQIGDRDLATHILRTTRLSRGETLSEITSDFCRQWGILHPVYPMSNEPVHTFVHTACGETLAFQEYFVHQKFQPVVRSFEYKGAENAFPIKGAMKKLKDCDLVIIAPSNPWVSIAPILAIPGYHEAMLNKTVIAISPLIGGKAMKGPAAKICAELGFQPCAAAVADYYRDLITGFAFDTVDRDQLEIIQRWAIIPLVTSIIMKDKKDRVRLANEVLKFCTLVLNRSL